MLNGGAYVMWKRLYKIYLRCYSDVPFQYFTFRGSLKIFSKSAARIEFSTETIKIRDLGLCGRHHGQGIKSLDRWLKLRKSPIFKFKKYYTFSDFDELGSRLIRVRWVQKLKRFDSKAHSRVTNFGSKYGKN